MFEMTPKERKKIRKAIRDDCVVGRVVSKLRRYFPQPDTKNSAYATAQQYPMTKYVVDVYEDEMVKRFMKLARKEAHKSQCARRKVGAVIVKDNEVISKGYNGVPHNLVRCTSENPCFKINNHIRSGSPVDKQDCRALHAEPYSLIRAAKLGKSTAGSTIFITHQPCCECALMIIAAGIIEVYYEEPYPDELALVLLRKAEIKVHKTKHD